MVVDLARWAILDEAPAAAARMTLDELEELEENLAIIARAHTANAQDAAVPGVVWTFREFIRRVNPRYQFYRHCEVLIDALQRVADGDLKRLMIFEPPRHGKSELTSRLFPAYYLYRHPEHFVGVNSYAAELAYTLSRNARDYYVAGGMTLSSGAAAVKHWETGKGGGLWAAGVGGPILGKGFNCGIIDDPIKNSAEAFSDTLRATQKDWFGATFYTREEPGGAIIIIQQRWHEDDLAGYLLQQELGDEPECWHIVNLPARRDASDVVFPPTCTVEPDWREVGEPLCPERFNDEKLRKREARLGPYFWGAVYQQRPSPAEGTVFKADMLCMTWEPHPIFWPESKLFDNPIQEAYLAWDTANKEKRQNDMTAGWLVALSRDNYLYLKCLYLGRKEVVKIPHLIAMEWATWKTILRDVLKGCRVEEGAGTVVLQDLREKRSQRLAYKRDEQARQQGAIVQDATEKPFGWPKEDWEKWLAAPPIVPIGFPATQDLVVRASGVVPLCAGRNVRMIDSGFASEALSQLMAFPTAAHDDAVSAFIAGLEPFLGITEGNEGMDEEALDDAHWD